MMEGFMTCACQPQTAFRYNPTGSDFCSLVYFSSFFW